MLRPRFALPVAAVAAVALAAASGIAQQPPAPPAKSAPAAAPTGPKEILRDPENKRGISPYMELIVKGQASFVARDLPGAVAQFQDAIKLDTEQLLGFYRLGETLLALGKIDDAESAWRTALSKKGPEDMQAKVLFVMADLCERQKKWQAAKDAWAAYRSFLEAHPKALGFPATAIERQKVIDKRMKDEVDYGAVKARIAKRQAEREAEALENAKKDKLNR